MLDSKTMMIVNGKIKNVDSFLVILCTLVITSIMGTSFAQEQQLSIAYASSNNLQPSVTNSKNLDLVHSFVSNKVVGPDRFRFVESYWTTEDTANSINVGTSTGAAAGTVVEESPPNPKLKVDTNEGPQTLAVVLQYQGVVNLAGVTAALKLPAGFKAQLPLTDDRNRFDIALSSFTGNIVPGQGVTLYFPVYVLPTAKVQLPVLGPVALHFLRTSQRSILDSIDANQQNVFAKTLSVMHTGNATLPNATFNDNFDFSRDYFNQFGRLIPYDFVNQVIPVIFKVTGQETLDVVTLPPGKFCDTSCKLQPNTSTTFSTQILNIPSDITTKVRLAVRNTGDAPVYDLDVNVTTGLQSALGINGLTPSAITSPNIPQTLFSTILPLGIVGGTAGLISVPELKPNTNEEFDVSVFPTHYVAGTVELLNIGLTWNNIIGERASQTNQVYFSVTPSSH
jgi:hypothetical protein